MALTRAARLEDLKAGQPHALRLGDRDYVLCRVEDAVYAVDGLCPHVGGPLAQGALHGRMLVCPWHSWEFDCVTGEHDRIAGCRLATYPVTVLDGEVLIELPNA